MLVKKIPKFQPLFQAVLSLRRLAKPIFTVCLSSVFFLFQNCLFLFGKQCTYGNAPYFEVLIQRKFTKKCSSLFDLQFQVFFFFFLGLSVPIYVSELFASSLFYLATAISQLAVDLLTALSVKLTFKMG